jgi:hypothetical protein
LDTQNTKNKIKIYHLVKDHFSLSPKSLSLFRHRLFFEPHVSKMYKRLFGDSIPDDLRIRIPMKTDIEQYDEGWMLLKKWLSSITYSQESKAQTFLFNLGDKLTYKDYIENLITIKKEKRKLFKYIKTELLKIFDENNGLNLNLPCKYDSLMRYHFFGEKETASKAIDGALHAISNLALPKKNSIELVISLNFADWFLCSTSESWSSCLNLESDCGYWMGIPGLIGDPNRSLVYITDGKKKNYQGIITDRFISRFWMFTGRSGKKEIFFPGFGYPNDHSNMNEELKKRFPNETFMLKQTNGEIKSRFYVENLFQKFEGVEFTAEVFHDNIQKKRFAKKNKAAYSPKEYSHYKIGAGGCGYEPLYKEGGGHGGFRPSSMNRGLYDAHGSIFNDYSYEDEEEENYEDEDEENY